MSQETFDLAAEGCVQTPKPTSSIVTITPETAERWLARNSRNRVLRKRDLDRYKRDMLAGAWHFDGAPIRFGSDGRLLDGQHRLQAIVETGITQTMSVIRGINPEAQAVMDTGRKRTAADALAIEGHAITPALAAVALLKISMDLDQLDGRHEASHSEIIRCINENPGLAVAVEMARNYARRCDCPPAVVAFAYYEMAKRDPQAAAQFWEAAANKVGLREGDPVIALTNRFAEARRNRERLTRRIYLSLIYRTWNARRAGKTMRMIRVNSPKGGIVPIPEMAA